MKPDRRHRDLSWSNPNGSPQKRGRGFAVLVGLIALILGGYWAVNVMGTFRAPGSAKSDKLSGPIAQLEERDSGRRRLAAMTLEATNLDLGPAMPALIRSLSDEDTVVRKYAALALAKAGTSAKQAVPALKACLNDPEPEVVEAARFALDKIEKGEEDKSVRHE